MAGGYQEEDRRRGEQQSAAAAAAAALPRPSPSPRTPSSILAGANSLLFSLPGLSSLGGSNHPSYGAPSSPHVVSPAPSEATPLVGGGRPMGGWRPAAAATAGEDSVVVVSSPGGTAEERRSRSPLSSVMLILGIIVLASIGAIALAVSHPPLNPSSLDGLAPEGGDLRLENEQEGLLLAREGARWWQRPSLLGGGATHATPAPTASPTLAPTPSPTLPALSESLALGVCWAPRAEMQDPEDIAQDALLIRRHFRQVRTFYSAFYQTPVLPYFVRAGLRVALGVFLYKDHPDWSEAEKQVAIASYHAHPEHTLAVYVGNEDLVPFGTYTVDDLIGHMDDIRKGGVKAPVGTVQRLTEWVMDDPAMDRLAAACDVMGVNVYPYFSIDNEDLPTQWAKMLRRYPQHAHKIRLTETGWPSSGSPNFANQTASEAQAEAYYNVYRKWACDRAAEGSPATETFYYAYFDGRAPPKAPDYEQWFGLVSPDGTPKYTSLADGFCPAEARLREQALALDREAAEQATTAAAAAVVAPAAEAEAKAAPVAAAEATEETETAVKKTEEESA